MDTNAEVLHIDGIVSQTRIALSNIGAALAGFGATMGDIVTVTTFTQTQPLPMSCTRTS